MSGHSAFITGIDVGGGAPSPPPSPPPRSPTAAEDGELPQFNPSALDFDAVYDPSGPTDVPLSVPLRSFIAETDPRFGSTNDEVLKHAWMQCFVESPEVADMCKDLFWWMLRKVVDANNLGASEKLDDGDDEQEKRRRPTDQTAPRQQAWSPRANQGGMFGTSMLHEEYDDMGGPGGPAIDEGEDSHGNDFFDSLALDEDAEDLAWIRSLDRANRVAKLNAESSLSAAVRAQEALRAPPAPRTEDLLLERLSENYLSLFRRTMFNIEAFCAADDPTDNFDDGLLPPAVSQGTIFRAMSFRSRHTCDRVLDAFPDAFAQATVRAVHRAAPRVVESFGIERLRMCAVDILNVCINGMRETKTNTGHWPAIGLGAILGATAQPARVKLPMTGIRKSTLGLHKELAKLSRKLDKSKLSEGEDAGARRLRGGAGGGQHASHMGSNSNTPRRGTMTTGDDSGGGTRDNVVDGEGPAIKLDEAGATETRMLAEHGGHAESMPLEKRHIVTKTRFVLGHSHFIGRLVEKNNRASSMRKHELTITLTTSSARPDLVPSLASTSSTSGSRARAGKDLFGWVANETLSRKNSIPARVGSSGGNDNPNGEDVGNNPQLHTGPVTVSMALAASRARAQQILEKSKQASIRARKSVQKIRRRQKIDLDGIAKEARRTRRGDMVNELANNLANLSSNPNKKL